MKGLRIDHYSFGRMTVGGKEFTSDLIIHPDGRIENNWWRKEGHNLVPEDITGLLEALPDRVIIGTGNSGVMAVSPRVLELCRKRGIEVETLPTKEAVKSFNEAVKENVSLAACFHLTC